MNTLSSFVDALRLIILVTATAEWDIWEAKTLKFAFFHRSTDFQ